LIFKIRIFFLKKISFAFLSSKLKKLFPEIVTEEKIKRFNSINLKEGYPVLEIRTPKEMISYE
jgi:hypothetical protein